MEKNLAVAWLAEVEQEAGGEAEGVSALTCYVRALRRVPRLSVAAEAELAEAVRAGRREAWQALVEANLRLVVFCARRFRDRGLALEDLVAEGNLGLMRAADLYDPSHGSRFASYAMWWIRARIERALINQGRTVRLSCNRSAKLVRLYRLRRHLAAEMGREPSEAELAASAGVDALEISALQEDAKGVLSLSAPTSGRPAVALEDLLADGGLSAEQRAVFVQAWHALQPAWRRLSTRQRQVLSARFGLNGAAEQSLADLGRLLGISRERARQIEREALQVLAAALSQPSAVGSASTRRRQSASAQAAASA